MRFSETMRPYVDIKPKNWILLPRPLKTCDLRLQLILWRRLLGLLSGSCLISAWNRRFCLLLRRRVGRLMMRVPSLLRMVSVGVGRRMFARRFSVSQTGALKSTRQVRRPRRMLAFRLCVAVHAVRRPLVVQWRWRSVSGIRSGIASICSRRRGAPWRGIRRMLRIVADRGVIHVRACFDLVALLAVRIGG
jgi:hypothetical protein